MDIKTSILREVSANLRNFLLICVDAKKGDRLFAFSIPPEMAMRFLRQTSLVFGLLTLTSLLPLGSSPLCPEVAIASDHRTIGQDGRNGDAGRDGRAGRSGQDQTITANGSDLNLNLSGDAGDDGEDGDDALRARCRRQAEKPNHDLQAADGGNGGRGGNGGNGGNGGDLMVYYTDPTALKRILVQAEGGEGGRGGQGGYGTAGCNCDRRRWEVEVCQGTPGSADYKCKSRSYTCTDGRDGSDGADGRDGRDGQLGMLSLVRQTQPLAVENPMQEVAIAQLNGRDISLSKNLWQRRNGATALLAPGSVIADEYREFIEQISGSFRLVVKDPRSLADVANQTAKLELNDDKQVQITFPEDIWVQGISAQQGNQTVYTVAATLRQQDATQLKVADFTGKGPALSLAVVDLARKSDIVATQFRVKYRSTNSGDRFGSNDYRTRYEGEVPANLVSQDYNRFAIALGKLPISAEYFSPGTNVEVELTAIRSLGDRSANQTLRWQGEVRSR